MRQIKRIAWDLVIAFTLLFVYTFQLYDFLPLPLQLLSVKILLVSLGFIHAHITRKIAFPRVNWEGEKINAKNLLIMLLYCTFIIAYAFGG